MCESVCACVCVYVYVVCVCACMCESVCVCVCVVCVNTFCIHFLFFVSIFFLFHPQCAQRSNRPQKKTEDQRCLTSRVFSSVCVCVCGRVCVCVFVLYRDLCIHTCGVCGG